MYAGESWVGNRKKDRSLIEHQLEENGSPVVGRKSVDNLWTTVNWAIYGGEVLEMRALRSILGWTQAAVSKSLAECSAVAVVPQILLFKTFSFCCVTLAKHPVIFHATSVSPLFLLRTPASSAQTFGIAAMVISPKCS